MIGFAEPTDSHRNRVDDLPPSAKLVFKVLEYNGELSVSDIEHQSRLPERTVRFAINELEDVGVIANRTSLRDARRTLYHITEVDTGD